MARGTRATTQTTQTPKAPRSTAKPEKAKSKAPAPKTTLAKAAAERAPMLTKGELRAQVEKLERANATLRAKGREATKAAKTAAARIAELEDEAAALAKQVTPQAASAKRSVTRSTARRGRNIDPGDAVPPGVAIQEPEPMDREAETALENLEEHLGGGGKTNRSGASSKRVGG
jgi:chromosome segregation ATPase